MTEIVEVEKEEQPEEPLLQTDPALHDRIIQVLKDYPRLDYIQAYCLLTLEKEQLDKYLGKKIEPQKDFAEKCKLTIEEAEVNSENKEKVNELFA
tara:strand:- start:8338 stop:8622 length:285 start_codon:yes stop_codon:yes gene_type:complete